MTVRMCEGSRPVDNAPATGAEVSKSQQVDNDTTTSKGFALMPAKWQIKKMLVPDSTTDNGVNKPLMSTYRVNRMFPIAANIAAVVFVFLLYFVYRITPVEEWQYLPDSERLVATIAFSIAAMSTTTVVITFIFWRHETGRVSGIVYAGLVVMIISMTTNGILAFAPTVVKNDPIIYSRVFLVRWCEWIPCSGLMTFLCDAVDVPRSKKAFRTALMYSLCQSVSCVFGLIFPYCPGVISWSIAIFWSCAAWAPIFPRLHYKYKIFRATPKGGSFAEMERYNRHKYSYELMLLCAMLWSFLVFAYFANGYAHVMLPEGHFLRPYSLAMYVDAAFDVMAKSLYMRQIMDTHRAVFESEGLAQRQLVELRRLMSVLWSSSSDMIVLSIKHELKCLTIFSPAFAGILTGQNPTSAAEERALIIEFERDFTDELFPQDQDDLPKVPSLGRIDKIYHIDSTDVAFDSHQEASAEARVEPDSFKAEIASNIVKEAWSFILDPPKDGSPLLPYDFDRPDGVRCSCEMKVVPHAENGMIAIVRDVSERFRRFEAERKAEAEALRRQKESQSVRNFIPFWIMIFRHILTQHFSVQQTRFVRHEVKNGLLVGIELIDSLRNAIDDIHKERQAPQAGSHELASVKKLEEGNQISDCWTRLGELDTNLHEVLDTVLAEAMARDVIHEVYHPRFESLDVVALLRSTGKNADRFPVRSPQPDIPYLRLDPQLLRYIHRNAVSNACKYGSQGGLVVTLVAYHTDTSEFELQVINDPGSGHEKLIELGNAAGDAVFEQGSRLHKDLSINDRYISSGDGAWIAQKCAKAMGGSCNIQFEPDMTVFAFKCPTEPLEPAEKAQTADFEVPPETLGVAIDDSKIQRKLMSRILGLIGVAEEHRMVIGEKPSDAYEMEKMIQDALKSRPNAKILVMVDENLDYGEKGEEVVIMSGSRIMKDILTALPPEDEKRVFALVRSANDSTSDLATYRSRTHGFFPKAPMNREKVREILAPLWAERFKNSQ